MSKVNHLVQLLEHRYSDRKIFVTVNKNLIEICIDDNYFAFDVIDLVEMKTFHPQIDVLLDHANIICEEIDESFILKQV